MPVPPGSYGVKGIFTPAEKWEVDGEYHAIVPRFVTGISPWIPRSRAVEEAGALLRRLIPRAGLRISRMSMSGTNGIAVFYYGYLEIVANNVQVRLEETDRFRATSAHV